MLWYLLLQICLLEDIFKNSHTQKAQESFPKNLIHSLSDILRLVENFTCLGTLGKTSDVTSWLYYTLK